MPGLSRCKSRAFPTHVLFQEAMQRSDVHCSKEGSKISSRETNKFMEGEKNRGSPPRECGRHKTGHLRNRRTKVKNENWATIQNAVFRGRGLDLCISLNFIEKDALGVFLD